MCKIKENVPLGSYTTLEVKSQAQYLVECRSSKELLDALDFASEHHLPFYIIGKGSNIWVTKSRIVGLVIVNKIQCIHPLEKGVFDVGAGTSFPYLSLQTAKLGFTGLEFALGIPGSVGGAIAMNAGARGQETADTVLQVECITRDKKLIWLQKEEIDFRYRFSSFQKNGAIITRARFQLSKRDNARQTQKEMLAYRLQTQPYKAKTAGCFFRNPREGKTAGALIEECGLKGFQIGGACVSNLHANFIENINEATPEDIAQLIKQIQRIVYEKTHIELALEVKKLG